MVVEIMRKPATIILLLLIIIPAFGFGKTSPDEVVVKYLKSLYANELQKTYSYISQADKNAISKDDFIRRNSLDDPFIQEIAETVSSLRKYKVNKTIIKKDSASVNITVTSPDMSKVMGEIFGPFHGPKNMKNPQEATRHMLKQFLKKGNVPMVDERGTFTLLKEKGKWKVFLNLKK